MTEHCPTCGSLEGIREYDAKLWDIYYRIEDGRSNYQPLVYCQDDLAELGFYEDEETHDAVMMSMEKNMHERGLCTRCGRPDLTGVTDDMILSEDDAQELHEMYAEMEAERRMGA